MKIGNTIREIRRSKNLTQSMLAKRAGTSQTYLSQIEGGSKKGSHKFNESLAKALDTPWPIIIWKSIEREDIPADRREIWDSIKGPMGELLKELV